MPTSDTHTGDPFSLETLTAAINRQPYRPGQISASGLYSEDSVTTTAISIEQKDGKLGLVNTSARGSNGETTGDEGRKKIPFNIDHYQRDDRVLADEVQGVRAFGSETEPEIIEDRVNSKVARHGADLTMTLEHQRVGGVKGIVTEKSGSVLLNLYSMFGISVPPSVSLELDVETTDVVQLIQDTVNGVEDVLDTPYDHFECWNGRAMHNALWRHKSVKDTFLYHQGAGELRLAVPDEFELGGVTFRRYKTGAKATADAGAAYIADNEGRMVVTGVDDLFITRFAPADYTETVNTLGLPLYARAIEMRNGKGYDLEIQSNPISLCTQPETLRTFTLT